jgi:hypothetical protein
MMWLMFTGDHFPKSITSFLELINADGFWQWNIEVKDDAIIYDYI